MHYLKRNLFKKTTAMFLIVFLTVSFLFPQKSLAGRGDADDWANILSSVSNAATAASAAISSAADAITSAGVSSLVVKEYVLDGIVPFIREALIKSLTASIVNWINSGFEGDPMFVTDLQGFLLDVANEASGQFIYEMGLTDLCSAFRPQLLFQMSYRQSYQQRAQCTVLDVIDNLEAFQEDFRYGGWRGFISVLEPQNNYYGSSYIAADENTERMELAVEINQTKLSWGKGFLSWDECSKYLDESDPSMGCLEWKTNTPGSVIYKQLNEVMPTGLKNLELADEINEIIGALLTQLMKQALGGSGGLYGASYSYDGNVPLLETYTSGNANPGDLKENVEGEINKDIQNEEDFISIKKDSLSAVDIAEVKLKNAQACYQEKANSGVVYYGVFATRWGEEITRSLSPADAQRKANEIQSMLDGQIYPLNSDTGGNLVRDIQKANDNMNDLYNLKDDMRATTNIKSLNALVNEYQSFKESGYLHDFKDIIDAQFERDGKPGTNDGGLVGKMAKIGSKAETDENDCRTYR